jgi:hypothetical protein
MQQSAPGLARGGRQYTQCGKAGFGERPSLRHFKGEIYSAF